VGVQNGRVPKEGLRVWNTRDVILLLTRDISLIYAISNSYFGPPASTWRKRYINRDSNHSTLGKRQHSLVLLEKRQKIGKEFLKLVKCTLVYIQNR
jgi:hypothetical protein